MINLKNMSGESGFFAVTAIAICVVLVVGVVGLLAPAAASPGVSTNNSATYATPGSAPLWLRNVRFGSVSAMSQTGQ